jgi:two-component system response regulator
MKEAILESSITEKIHIVDNGESALNFIFAKGEYEIRNDAQLPKLILLDLNLPKVSGIEIIKKLKENESTKTLPVIVMTVSQNDEDYKKCIELGANSYIIKPFNSNKFTNIVRDIGSFWITTS